MRLFVRLEDEQKYCASCSTYSVPIPKFIALFLIEIVMKLLCAFSTHGRLSIKSNASTLKSMPSTSTCLPFLTYLNAIMTDETITPIKNTPRVKQRKAVRYITYSPNKAIITIKQFLGPKTYIHARVINISSKGARIYSKYEFTANTSIILNIKIKSGESWKIPAKVIELYSDSEFGIIYNATQQDLVDQILKHEEKFGIT